MFDRGEATQSPNGGGARAAEAQYDALRERLVDGETVCYRLAARKPVVLGDDGDRELLADPTGREWAVVLTDANCYVVAAGDDATDVTTIPYRDVRSVDVESGLLGSRLVLRVWNRGTLRAALARGAPAVAAGEFLERATETTQRVIAALDDARDEITALGTHVESGDRAAAQSARVAVAEHLSRARTRIDDGPDRLADALSDRVSTVTTELARTRMRAHVARGTTLAERGDDLTDAEAWTDAVAAYRRAEAHLSTARSAARDGEFDLADAIDSEQAALEARIERLEGRPLRLALAAHEAALEASDPRSAIPAWAEALEHYRAAVTAGWGTPVDFDGDRETLCERVESVARNLIGARRTVAGSLRSDGDDCRMAGDDAAAADRYEAALDQLEAALAVARELRAGDADAIADHRTVLRQRLAAARRGRDTEADDSPAGADPSTTEPRVDILAHKP